MARLSQRLVMVASLVLGGLTLSACGRDGLGEARQACTIARAGIHSYEARTCDLRHSDDQAAVRFNLVERLPLLAPDAGVEPLERTIVEHGIFPTIEHTDDCIV